MSRELRLSIKRQKRIMPALPFSEDAVAALLDPFAEAEVRRLGPDPSWDVVGATLAGHAAAGGAGAGIWSRVLAEFTDFVCTESSRYADLRAEWDDLCSRSAAVAVASDVRPSWIRPAGDQSRARRGRFCPGRRGRDLRFEARVRTGDRPHHLRVGLLEAREAIDALRD
jgi:hypothetical protein